MLCAILNKFWMQHPAQHIATAIVQLLSSYHINQPNKANKHVILWLLMEKEIKK